jgi:hypothetical protein
MRDSARGYSSSHHDVTVIRLQQRMVPLTVCVVWRVPVGEPAVTNFNIV